jgi:hypothetical protein
VPSRASIFTGRSPVAIAMSRFSAPLPREIKTYPEALRAAGWFTGVAGRMYHMDGANVNVAEILRGHHGDASRIYPRKVMLEKWDAVKAPRPEYSHGTSFVHACLGNTTTTSPFSVSGELTQVLNLGMIAEYLNVDLNFDPKAKRFIGNDEANQLLAGAPPRAEWAHYYTLA